MKTLWEVSGMDHTPSAGEVEALVDVAKLTEDYIRDHLHEAYCSTNDGAHPNSTVLDGATFAIAMLLMYRATARAAICSDCFADACAYVGDKFMHNWLVEFGSLNAMCQAGDGSCPDYERAELPSNDNKRGLT